MPSEPCENRVRRGMTTGRRRFEFSLLLVLCSAQVASAQDGFRQGQPANGAPDVVDHCNRSDPSFMPITDPVADVALTARLRLLPERLRDPEWQRQCRLPAFGTQVVRGRGARSYDKYDQYFLAAAWFWVLEIDGRDHPQEVGQLAHLMKVMSWYESKVGYVSGFTNRMHGGQLRFPLQAPGFIDTEDVLQIGNPADLPIHEKVREMVALHYQDSQRVVELVPRTYTNRNISGPQSIFYGTGWFAYKYCTCGRSALEAIRRYNGNRAVDGWNGKPHRDNYVESVHVLFQTGVARSPASGAELLLVTP